jgi:hypothetical protein
MNSKRWATSRLFVTSWCHNLVIGFSSIGYVVALVAWFFMVNLKRELCNSKTSLESGSKTHLPLVPTFWKYGNDVWSRQNGP